MGRTGPAGEKGDKGFRGLQGPMGIPGPSGRKGEKGTDGAKGSSGSAGTPGLRGLKTSCYHSFLVTWFPQNLKILENLEEYPFLKKVIEILEKLGEILKKNQSQGKVRG